MKKICRTLLLLLILGAIVSVGITFQRANLASLRRESGIMNYPPPCGEPPLTTLPPRPPYPYPPPCPEPPIEPDKIAT